MIHNKTKKYIYIYQTKRSELTKTIKPFIYGFNKVSIFKHRINQRKIEKIKKNDNLLVDKSLPTRTVTTTWKQTQIPKTLVKQKSKV